MKLTRIFLKIFLGVFLILTVLFTLFFGRNKITESHSFGRTENYKGIITLWQIDSFEGGIGSRKQFLLSVARSFERKNPGVLVMVIEHTEESMLEEVRKNNMPDMISFGAGVEITGFNELSLKGENGGAIGDKTYAVAWCRGGYTLIANPKLTGEINKSFDTLLVSQGEYTQPLTALYLEEMTAKNIIVKKPMDAYIEFVAGKTPYFLGTQRDIIRFERRQMEIMSKPLGKYNDLFQYIAVTASNNEKNFYAQSFIEHLLSDDIQKSLKSIGMMSTSLKVEYDNSHLSLMQEIGGFSTVSAFSNAKMLKEMQENSLALLGGKKELEIKIKNMLI